MKGIDSIERIETFIIENSSIDWLVILLNKLAGFFELVILIYFCLCDKVIKWDASINYCLDIMHSSRITHFTLRFWSEL